MRKFIVSTVALLLLLTSSAVYADGLIYRLPKDGASVRYKMDLVMEQNGMQMTGDGTLSVSSVGQAVVDDEKCRWIEFKMKIKLKDREQTIIAKVLIPEKHLGKGKTPIDHVKKCWFKQDGETREVKDVQGQKGGPMPIFLCGPLKDVKKLKQEVVESKLGKLPCEGLTGRLVTKQGKDDLDANLETRLHVKAPFGVMTLKIKLKISRDGQPQQKLTMTLHRAEVGKNAKSELTDNN